MGLKVGELYAELGIRDNKFTAGMDDAEKRAKKADKSVSGLSDAAGALGGVLAAGTVIVGLKAAAFAASDLAESTSKANVVFGSASASVQAFAKTSAQSMGMSSRVALEAAGTFGNLFVSMGLAQDKSAEMSMSIVQLAADLASFNNSSPEEALDALRSGLTGETEPLKRFGINLNDAMLKEEAMSMGLIKTTTEVLPPAVKAQAAYKAMLKQTGTAQGDFARTADGAANSVKIATAELENAKAELGQSLTPAMTDGAKAVSGLAAEFNALPDPVQNATVKIGLFATAAVAAFSFLKGPVESFVAMFPNAAGVISAGITKMSGPLALSLAAKDAYVKGNEDRNARLLASDNEAYQSFGRFGAAAKGATPEMIALSDAANTARIGLFTVTDAQAALATATRDATTAWQAQVLTLTPAENSIRSLAGQVVAAHDAQKAQADFLKGGGKKSSAEYADLTFRVKDAQALVAQTASVMTDKQITAAVKSGVLSKKMGDAAKKANDLGGKVDGVTAALDALPSSTSTKINVNTASAMGKIQSLLAAMRAGGLSSNANRIELFTGTPKPKTKKALGGFSRGAEEIIWGEAGREVIIPIKNDLNSRALLAQAAMEMGVGIGGGGSDTYVTVKADSFADGRRIGQELRSVITRPLAPSIG